MEVSRKFQTPAALSPGKIQLSVFSGWSSLRTSLDNFGKQKILLTLTEYQAFHQHERSSE